MQQEFTAFPRGTRNQGRSANRRLRRSGRAPGIVYGGSGEPQPIELDHNALIHALRNEAFHASILTMKLDGAAQQVLLRAVQMHPFKKEVLHVDFQRVDANRRIHMKVPLHFANGENSPAVKLSGAIISHVLTEVDISCLPKDLPEFIAVDLAELTLNESIHVSDLKLPPGVTAVVHGRLDPVVASAVIPKIIVEAEEAPAAEGEVEAGAPVTEAAEGETAEKAGEKVAEKAPDKAAEKGAERSGGKREEKK
ncbi:MAG TPA: 50S ribosomal protein L25/general stress protein Ctc [Casimicrobiaceae bacterium]|nr:50S ribosomal protein L25/general stress protein Ctc [Casimicrobiaceae bacterium]